MAGKSYASSNDPLPSPWPFDQSPACAVFTTTHVLRGGEPITHVYHDEDDHGWQFHYPGEKSVSDCMIVALEEIVRHDPSVLEVADLPPGYVAIRKEIGSPWDVERKSPYLGSADNLSFDFSANP